MQLLIYLHVQKKKKRYTINWKNPEETIPQQTEQPNMMDQVNIYMASGRNIV